MHKSGNWDDLRYVLAVVKAGSVSQAARDLGVNHTTVLRHVAAFEKISGAEIFDKSPTGYKVLDDRARIIDAARQVEIAVAAVQQIIHGARPPLTGLVRVTATDSFCQIILPPIICDLQNELTELRIDLQSTNIRVDFSRLNADIAVRPTDSLSEDLRGEKVAALGFDIYGAGGAAPDRWLGFSGALDKSVAAKWMSENVPADSVCGSADSFLALRELAARGLGQAVLPCVVGDSDPRLTRRRGILPDMQMNIWVASHADLVDVPRIKVVKKFLVSAFSDIADVLAGRG